MLFLPITLAGVARSGSASSAISITDVTDEIPTFARIIETMTFRAGFNTNLVIVGTSLLGLAAGIVGVFALLRKRSLVTDALSHATLPGIGMAFLVAGWLGLEGRSLPVLLFGASVTGVLGVICIQAILRYSRLREDAAIGIVLSVFFGAGIVVLSLIQANAPSGSAGIDGFIYGQAALMLPSDVMLMGGIAFVGVLAAVLLLKEFALVCFNDEFARVGGWSVGLIDLLMMALVVVVTVAGLQAVGLILVVAMLIIPPVAARFWTDRLWVLVLVAALIGALSGYAGSVVSALLPRKPAGAVIVLSSGAVFLFSFLLAPKRGVLASLITRARVRLRIAGDHFLEYAADLESDSLAREDFVRLADDRGWDRWFRFVLVLWLRSAGLMTWSKTLQLTDEGRARGGRVARNHALWNQYLVRYADIAPSHVDWSVDQVEHVLSDELVRELEAAIMEQDSTQHAGMGAS